MIPASEIRKGTVLEMDGNMYRVMNTQYNNPGRGAASMRAQLMDIGTGTTQYRVFSAEESLNNIYVETEDVKYLYGDADFLHFMNNETYEQLEVSKEVLGDDLVFLTPNMQVELEFYENQPLSATLPVSVVLEIVETDPVMKNANATGSYKPAKLENGVVVGVPPYMETGEKIRVKVEDRTYMERVK